MDKPVGLPLRNSMNNLACENFHYDQVHRSDIVVVIEGYNFTVNNNNNKEQI